jgi:hypothetical protein
MQETHKSMHIFTAHWNETSQSCNICWMLIFIVHEHFSLTTILMRDTQNERRVRTHSMFSSSLFLLSDGMVTYADLPLSFLFLFLFLFPFLFLFLFALVFVCSLEFKWGDTMSAGTHTSPQMKVNTIERALTTVE